MGLCGSKKQIIVPTKIIVKTDDVNNNNNYNKNKESVSKYSIQNNYNNEVNIHINNNNNIGNQNNIHNYNLNNKNGSNANCKESSSGILKLISINNSSNMSDNENKNKQNKDNDLLIIYPEKKNSNSNSNLIFKEKNQRRIFHHKTSKNVNFNTRPSLRTLTPNQFEHNNFECTDTNIDNDESNNYVNRAAFKRRNKRGKTLVDKSKLGSKIFKEELKLTVLNETLINEEKGDPKVKYKILNKLGDGSYGTVYCAINIQIGAKIAMKQIEKKKENEIDDLELINEINILKKLDHPNIVKIFEFYSTKKKYFIITEFCKHGELYGYIKRKYNETQLAVLFYQVFSGLCYLHENNILHRDLKLENIMISDIEKDIKTDNEFFWIKIIDFGTAKIFKKSRNEKAIVGSSYYIAPEVLKQKYNEKCDTWSVGVILYMLIVGRAPFDGKNDDEIIESIKIGHFNREHPKLMACSNEVQDLINSLLEINIKKRLSAKEALEHPWFKKFGGRSLFSNFNFNDIIEYINNLLHFQFQSKFQQLVLAFVVHNIPNTNDTKNILKLFRYFNIKGDCKLTKEELTNGLYQFASKENVDNVIDDIFLLLDGDNTGYIEYEEFLRACIDKKKILNDDNLLYAFKFLDRDNTGILDCDKIMCFFVQKTNKVLEQIFMNSIKEVDTDNDGIIDFNEFKQLMLSVQ